MKLPSIFHPTILLKKSLLVPMLALVVTACGPSEQQEATEENAASAEPSSQSVGFSPDPQAVPEPEGGVETLEIGKKAPDFNLPGVDGEYHSLDEYQDAEVLVIVFTCNHCPTAQAYEERIIQFTQDYQDKGVQVVAISPNSPPALLHEECGYTDLHDTYEEMIIRAKVRNFNFPYLYDGDTEAVSIQYGPVATPHVFVFDADRRLQYTGRLDSSEKPDTANAEDLREAVDAILAGNPVPNPVTKTFGCSVKWAWKDQFTKKVNKEWAETPVEIEEIDEAGIEQLLANDSEKLRLINVWATWCGPCIIEYPEFVTIHRMYMGRDFEFVSISADKPENKEKALKFLRKSESALTNYIFSKEDKYALIEAVDPDWNGALPYTMLVEPGGKVIMAHQGTIDPLELKQTIVQHPMIGRYY